MQLCAGPRGNVHLDFLLEYPTLVTVHSSSRRLRWGVLWGLVALAVSLRWYKLGESSVWIDEGASIRFVQLPWDRFLQVLWQWEANMTAYYLLLRGWILFGDSEAWLRSLSAACGTLSIPMLYLLGKRLYTQRIGMIAAALLSVNLLHLWLTREVRSYSLVVLLVLISLFCFVTAIERPTRSWYWLGYVAASVVGAYCHFFMLLVIAAQWLAVSPRRLREIGLRRLACILIPLLLLLSPIVVFALLQDQGQLVWVEPLSIAGILTTLVATCGFNPLLLVLTCVGLGLFCKGLTGDDEGALRQRVVVIGYCFPILVVALVSFVKPLMFFRFFAICLPVAALAGARALSPERQLSPAKRFLVLALLTLTLGFSLLLSTGISSQFNNWGGDWRSATNQVLSSRQPGDGILFHLSAGSDCYSYYSQRGELSPGTAPLPRVVFPPEGALPSANPNPDAEQLMKACNGAPRVWVVLHQRTAEDLPAKFLETYQLVEEQVYPGIDPLMNITVSLYAVGP